MRYMDVEKGSWKAPVEYLFTMKWLPNIYSFLSVHIQTVCTG